MRRGAIHIEAAKYDRDGKVVSPAHIVLENGEVVTGNRYHKELSLARRRFLAQRLRTIKRFYAELRRDIRKAEEKS